MKKGLWIGLLIGGLSGTVYGFADDFVEDAYYWPTYELQKPLDAQQLQPYYNPKKVKELIFIDPAPQDTTAKTDSLTLQKH